MANKNSKAVMPEIVRLHDRMDVQDKALADQGSTLKEQGTTLASHGLQLTRIDMRFQELHGNGSGRKGAIEKIQDDMSALSRSVNEMRQSQAVFYAEQRLSSVAHNKLEHTKDAVNNKWIEWFKFLAGPLAIVVWELFKIYVLGVKK